MPASPAELFDRHHLAVYRYVLRMTGWSDLAEDLTQEVFLRVVRGQVRYEDRGRERAWLICIARNLLTDWRRKTRREPTEQAQSEPAGTPGPGPGLELRQALARLPEEDRDVFLLREVVGLGHDEIAGAVGATPASVRCRIYRARAALRAMLSA